MEVYNIFISYRRKGGFETAKHLFDLLTRDGYKVAFDIDTLRNGRFDTRIYDLINECSDFLIVLSRGVFNRTMNPFCGIENDWVRLELREAIRLKKNIVPVMLSGFSYPWFLPKDVNPIRYINASECNMVYFNEFYNKLKSFLIAKPNCGHSQGETNVEAQIDNYEINMAAVRAGAYTMLDYSSKESPKGNVGLNNAINTLGIPLSNICNNYVAEGKVDINLLLDKIAEMYDKSASEFASFGFHFAIVAMLDNTPNPKFREEQQKKFIDIGMRLAIPMGLLEYMANAPLLDFRECLKKLYIFLPQRLNAAKRCKVCNSLLASDYMIISLFRYRHIAPRVPSSRLD